MTVTRRKTPAQALAVQIARLEEQAGIHRRKGDEAKALRTAASVHKARREWREAWELEERALELERRLHDRLKPNGRS